MEISPDGTTAYVPNWWTEEINVIDIATGNSVPVLIADVTTQSQQTASDGVAVSPDGSSVYIPAANLGLIFELLTATNTIAPDSIRGSTTHATFIGLALSPDGTLLYGPELVNAASTEGALSVIDLATFTPGQFPDEVLDVGNRPTAAVTAPPTQVILSSLVARLDAIAAAEPTTSDGMAAAEASTLLEAARSDLDETPPDYQSASDNIAAATDVLLDSTIVAAAGEGRLGPPALLLTASPFVAGGGYGVGGWLPRARAQVPVDEDLAAVVRQLVLSARQLAVDAIVRAERRDGDPSELDEARSRLALGDALRDIEDFDGAAGAYGEVLDAAAGAIVVAELQRLVDRLSDFAGLNRGQRRSLASKLEAAEAQVSSGNFTAAIQQIEGFREQVRALARSGVLSAGEADELLRSTQAMIERLRLG